MGRWLAKIQRTHVLTEGKPPDLSNIIDQLPRPPDFDFANQFHAAAVAEWMAENTEVYTRTLGDARQVSDVVIQGLHRGEAVHEERDVTGGRKTKLTTSSEVVLVMIPSVQSLPRLISLREIADGRRNRFSVKGMLEMFSLREK